MPKNLLFFLNVLKKYLTIAIIFGFCFMGLSSNIFAIDSNSSLFEQNQKTSSSREKVSPPLALPEESPNPSPGIFSTLLRLLFALSLIIGLIFATVWSLKIVWEKRGWNNQIEEGKPIKVLTSTYLSARKVIHLVEIGKRILVVGAGTDEMNCLDVITQPEEVDALRQGAQQGFPKIFSHILQKHDVTDQEAETRKIVEESRRVLGGYMEKLKKISKKKKIENGPIDEDRL